jgi:4-alpha-glucanotransferase
VRFDREWARVRAHAADLGISLLGDAAFYVAAGGADHRMHAELFREDVVGGVPPDDWSATGQLWGNPVYDWARMAADGFGWWIERLRRALALFDAVRIDHFRGFVAYWAVPIGQRTAMEGRWLRGPGRALFDAARDELGELPLVAEDLGLITPAVERLRREIAAPGNAVLHFSFGRERRDWSRIVPSDAFVYTGTHDNDTTVGWWASTSDAQRARVRRALEASGLDAGGLGDDEPHWLLIRLALRSAAAVAIIPAQDVLGLGSAARMNRPGAATGNWAWRLAPGQLTRDLALRLRDETEAGGR